MKEIAEALLKEAEKIEAERRKAVERENDSKFLDWFNQVEINRRIEERRERKAETEAQAAWLKRKEREAVFLFLTYQQRLQDAFNKIDGQLRVLLPEFLADPAFESRFVEGFRRSWHKEGKINSLVDVENALKTDALDKIKQELVEKLKNNPYKWSADKIGL